MRVIKSKDKVKYGGFSNTTFTYDSHKKIFFNLKREFFHNLSIVVDISEWNVIKLDSSGHLLNELSALRDFDGLHKSFIEFPDINKSLIERSVHTAEEEQGIEELHHEGLDHDDVTGWENTLLGVICGENKIESEATTENESLYSI